jgi:hypothetical protein
MTAANFGSSEGIRSGGWKNTQSTNVQTKFSLSTLKIMRYSDVLLMKAECENQKWWRTICLRLTLKK